MHRSPTQEVRIGKPGNHPKHALLFSSAQPRLKPNEIPHPPTAILHAKLRDRIRVAAGPWITKADGLHWPKTKRLTTAPSHLLDGHAPLEVRDRVEVVSLVLISGDERVDERVVPAHGQA